jgi:pimeloyl-ACP methyl ester carboxylesterase
MALNISSGNSSSIFSYVKEVAADSASCAQSVFVSSSKAVVKKIHWVIENRGGLACLLGLVMVPSQLSCPGYKKSEEIIERAAQCRGCHIERFSLPMPDNSTIGGVIYYPENWSPQDDSKCVLYHNPNAVTISGYLKDGELAWTPAEIVKLSGCPIILYDYRGTGVSSNQSGSNWLGFRATYESVVEDGEAMLAHALQSFGSVKIVGSSLGAGVATASLDRHLAKKPQDSSKVSLFNHDSFSTTPRVIFPYLPEIADRVGNLLGGMLDAATPMKHLVGRGIPITVLYHQKDPIIPKGARMAEYVATLPRSSHVSVIYSEEYGHANLSQDMCLLLGKI